MPNHRTVLATALCSAFSLSLVPLSAAAETVSAQDLPVGLAYASIAETVVVTATRQRQRADEVIASVEVIEREEIERAAHSTLIDVLRSRPGVRVASNGGPGANASVFLRGAESRHALLLIDGMRVGSGTSGQATFEAIPLGIIERIEIVRGPASALYGSEAIGGVIQIFTRKGEAGFHPELFAGYGSNDTARLSASAAGGENRLRYSFAVGQDRTRGFNAKRDVPQWRSSWGDSYDPDRDGFRNDWMTASASLGFRDDDEVGLNLYHSDGRNDYDANDFYDSYLTKRIASSGLYMRNAISASWTSTVRLGTSEDRLRNKPAPGDVSRFNTRQNQFSWQNDLALPLGSLLVAYDYVQTRVSGTTDYSTDKRTVHAGLLGWSADIDDHSVQVNLRYDDNSQFGSKTTGHLGYAYRFTPQWTVLGSVSTAFNAPTFNQLYWPDTGFGGGSPDLKPEKALNREIGLRWNDGLNGVELTYYNNRVRDLISGWPPANLDRAKLEGVELVLRTQVAGFDLEAGADWLNARNQETGNRLARRARHAGYVRADTTSGAWRWGVELEGQGARYDDAANRYRLSGFGLVHAYAHYAFAPDWRVELRASNLLDKDYTVARGYATEGRTVFVGVRYAPR